MCTAKLEQIGREEVMASWLAGGDARKYLVKIAGYATEHSMRNGMSALGWIPKPPSREAGAERPNGDSAKPRQPRVKGCLSLRVESWLDDQQDRPEGGWTPETVMPYVKGNSPAWLKKIGQCGPEEIEALENWLNHGATVERQAAYASKQAEAGRSKVQNVLGYNMGRILPKLKDAGAYELCADLMAVLNKHGIKLETTEPAAESGEPVNAEPAKPEPAPVNPAIDANLNGDTKAAKPSRTRKAAGSK